MIMGSTTGIEEKTNKSLDHVTKLLRQVKIATKLFHAIKATYEQNLTVLPFTVLVIKQYIFATLHGKSRFNVTNIQGRRKSGGLQK